MGCEASPNGVTLQFFDASGGDLSRSVSGKYAKLYSKHRPVQHGHTNQLLGSQDWLTDILVADSDAKLKAMTPTCNCIDQTSACSMDVSLQWDVGNNGEAHEDCLSIAFGTPKGGAVVVDKIYILPAGTVMANGHKLWHDWVRQADLLLNLAQAHASTKSQSLNKPKSPKKPKSAKKPSQ